MRGKVPNRSCETLLLRITPAYAGKRSTKKFVSSAYQDHPRLCGEKLQDSILQVLFPGSPPPMRGKALAKSVTRDNLRITPAYAGKRGELQEHLFPIQDHPRLCGEKWQCLIDCGVSEGSPPPMRGKVCVQLRHLSKKRITPAYAGKSLKRHIRQKANWDHPRLCGEKLDSGGVKYTILGSPPPMRGKAAFRKTVYQSFWITPAYAGKSFRKTIMLIPTSDHPRLCGEKDATVSWVAECLGSPPPMRGKVQRLSNGKSFSRITPAYAGKSQ